MKKFKECDLSTRFLKVQNKTLKECLEMLTECKKHDFRDKIINMHVIK